MTNHPNRTVYRYFKLSPRGFANEVVYYRVKPSEVAEVEAAYGDYVDKNPGTVAAWTNDLAATQPGRAIAWEDRNR